MDVAESSERPLKRVKQVAEVRPDAPASTTEAPVDNVLDDLEEEEIQPEEPDNSGRASDLYLDTVNRAALDFDFEKLCSVSLTNINIYGCLVCGKYFQGRGRSSYAYLHSIHEDHHVFINLESRKVYVLPDGYLVSDPSLEDISFVINPTFTAPQIATFSTASHLTKLSFDLSSKAYLPGYIGLNNIKSNDYLNVIIHLLLHVPPLRDTLLLSGYSSKQSELLRRFAGLAKKVWNPRLFKAQVSPHEFLQEVTRVSAGKFKITEQGDPVEFLGWLLNKLHLDMGGSRKRNSSPIYAIFQGDVRIDTQQVIVKPEMEGERPHFDIDREIKSTRSPFLFLAVDLPPPPLFQDSVEKNIIPQVSLASVMAKFDGRTTQEFAGQLKRYNCTRLPPYIILHFKRFTKNNFVEEKNPTIVNFPLRGFDFREYIGVPASTSSTLYDLVANVTHESTAGTTRDKENTVWKIQLRAGKWGTSGVAAADVEGEKWIQVQDLIVEDIRREMIFLGETVLQIWERREKEDVAMSNA